MFVGLEDAHDIDHEEVVGNSDRPGAIMTDKLREHIEKQMRPSVVDGLWAHFQDDRQ